MEGSNKNNSNAKKTSNTIKEKLNRNKIVIPIVLVVLIMILIIILFGVGYSKYKETINGTTSTKIAEMICEMDIEPSEDNKTIINPYCMVTVRDYNSSNEITRNRCRLYNRSITKGRF